MKVDNDFPEADSPYALSASDMKPQTTLSSSRNRKAAEFYVCFSFGADTWPRLRPVDLHDALAAYCSTSHMQRFWV